MKAVIFSLLFFVSISSFAQFMNPRGGMNQRGRMGQPQMRNPQPQKPPAFDGKKAIGIVNYDPEKTAKKISLKKSGKKFDSFKKIIVKFNKEINDVARINSFTFSEAKVKIESAQKLASESRDYSVLQNTYKEVSDLFKPIVNEVNRKEEELDNSLKPLLSEKQFKKWKKYKQKRKK